ncbi:MAG: RagB/SusD family nutrient uptake outer membrane protein [Paludibacteraceae bacterium]
MKKNIIKILMSAIIFAGLSTSCQNDLLDQPSRVSLTTSTFWETIDDAEYALNGAVADIRYLFNRDYYLDAMGEYLNVSGNTLQGAASAVSVTNSRKLKNGAAYDGFYELYPVDNGSKFDNMYRFCYGGINRCNYVIDGLEKMLDNESSEDNRRRLNELIGEAKLFRSLIYLRLISMWGDVPYIDQRIYYKEEVETISRTALAKIVEYLIADLTYAADVLPDKAKKSGRMAKPAALALRGKVQLYWASWNNFGWPELDTFTPDVQEAQKAYKAAATDFKSVIDDFGLTLFRNGDPGECDTLGKADKLPNYYYLFTNVANGDPEFVITFNHGGVGTNQSESLLQDFSGRNFEYSNCWINPRFALLNRYQSLTTGDFCDSLITMAGSDATSRTTPNSALNPQSYNNRDYRLKASIMWDFEMAMGIYDKTETDWVIFVYKNDPAKDTQGLDGKMYDTYETDRCKTGYVFRKFVRNYPGQGRAEGDVNWPVMRLADIYLMYAEAVNFAEMTGEKDYAVEMLNRVRRRGNLPNLKAEKAATQDTFFEAIEQERIVELAAEGHRLFDLRRWRKIEDSFCPPGDAVGYLSHDTWGNPVTGYSSSGVFFQNATNLSYQRCYIFKIPQSERDKNPNLTQNKPFL